MTRVCARQDCPNALTGMRSDAIYCSNACKARVWRARTGYRLVARYDTAQTPVIRRRSRPSDIRISYRTLITVLERELNSPIRARDIAQQTLTPAARRRALELGL